MSSSLWSTRRCAFRFATLITLSRSGVLVISIVPMSLKYEKGGSRNLHPFLTDEMNILCRFAVGNDAECTRLADGNIEEAVDVQSNLCIACRAVWVNQEVEATEVSEQQAL